MKYTFILVLTILLSSCILFKSSRVEDVFYNKSYSNGILNSNIIIQNLTVQKDLDHGTVKANAQYILGLLSAKYNEDLTQKASTLFAHIIIKEAPFIKNYETLNSVALEIKLTEDQDKKPVFIYLLSDETKNTISSYKYLYEILERPFKQIYK